MVLQGADLLLYPTAIGSEPQDATVDSQPHWRRCMQGHAAANVCPVVACNRVGREEDALVLGGADGATVAITFYGGSFACDGTGAIVAQAGAQVETLMCRLDLAAAQRARAGWGLFRDRRPELYDTLLTLDGETRRQQRPHPHA